MLIKGISGIKGTIISGIQWNGISISFVPELFLRGMIFQKNVDIFFWNGIRWNIHSFFSLQLMNILWNKNELSIQKVSIPKNVF